MLRISDQLTKRIITATAEVFKVCELEEDLREFEELMQDVSSCSNLVRLKRIFHFTDEVLRRQAE